MNKATTAVDPTCFDSFGKSFSNFSSVILNAWFKHFYTVLFKSLLCSIPLNTSSSCAFNSRCKFCAQNSAQIDPPWPSKTA
jgi:hypothetical protein